MRTILIVDDDPDVVALLGLAFEMAGTWVVRSAGSVAEATGVLAEGRADVVLTDDHLGDGRGEDVRNAGAGVPVILLSASVYAPPSVVVPLPGFAGAITKPFDPLALPVLVAQAMSRWTD